MAHYTMSRLSPGLLMAMNILHNDLLEIRHIKLYPWNEAYIIMGSFDLKCKNITLHYCILSFCHPDKKYIQIYKYCKCVQVLGSMQ